MRRAYLYAHLAIVLVTAYFSVTYFHPDEHFQVLEFVGHKLGTTSIEQMPWEFTARIRAWVQPAAYYVLARVAQAVGIRDIFAIAFLLRLASGALEWFAVAAIVRTSSRWSSDRAIGLAQLRVTTLLGFLPFLAVRTSSENVSCSLLTLAFCLVLDAIEVRGPAELPSRLPVRVALVGGLLLGLAFEVRYQTAVLSAGLVAWLLAFRRVRARGVAAMAGGGVTAVAVGLVIDRWGYGAWSFPAYRYVRANIVDHVASSQFGTDPFYGYLYLLPANIFAPVVVVLMAALALTWLRRPKHPVTWVTLPYAVVNSVLAHKEERLFFPMLLVSTTAVTLGLSPATRASPMPSLLRGVTRWADAVARRLWKLRRSPLAVLLVADNLLGLLLLAFYPLGWSADVAFYDYAYHHVESDARVWTRADWGFPDYPFYRRGAWVPRVPSGAGDVESGLRAQVPSYYLAPLPYEPVNAWGAGAKAELVYSEFPGWRFAFVREAVGPQLERLMGALASVPRAPKAKWLTLYRLESAGASGEAGAR